MSSPADLLFTLGGVFVAVGLLCLVVRVLDAISLGRLRAVGRWTEGEVVERSPDSAPSITVAFCDQGGAWHRRTSRGGSSGFPALGERTRVLYDPTDPRRARIEADMRMGTFVLTLLTFVFGGLGAAMIAVGFLAG